MKSLPSDPSKKRRKGKEEREREREKRKGKKTKEGTRRNFDDCTESATRFQKNVKKESTNTRTVASGTQKSKIEKKNHRSARDREKEREEAERNKNGRFLAIEDE